MARAYGGAEDYDPQELVVALGDQDLVCKELTDLGIAIQKTGESVPLGLALLTLDAGSVVAAGTQLRRQNPGLEESTIQAKWPGGQPKGIRPTALDYLLRQLRADFSSDYNGWIPEIGKNRMISPVRGLPYVSGCTENNPSLLGLEDPIPESALGWPQPRPAAPGSGVQVGLLDTRLYQDPWLAGGYLAAGKDLLTEPGSDGSFPALEGHATFIAGLILDQAPGATLIIRPAMGPLALGKTWDVAKVMADFVGTGVDILNLSFGCYTDDGQPPLVLARAVSLVSPQILLVAAAGNHGNIQQLRAENSPLAGPWTEHLQNTTPVWPAGFPEVTAVGAIDGDGQVTDFTPPAPWVDVTAPGKDVASIYFNGPVSLPPPPPDPSGTTGDSSLSETASTSPSSVTKNFGGFARWTGTSFAAGTVSGAVAANIRPGQDARQALQAVLADAQRYPGISKYQFPKP